MAPSCLKLQGGDLISFVAAKWHSAKLPLRLRGRLSKTQESLMLRSHPMYHCHLLKLSRAPVMNVETRGSREVESEVPCCLFLQACEGDESRWPPSPPLLAR